MHHHPHSKLIRFVGAILTAGLFHGSALAQITAKPYVDVQIDPAKSYWSDHVHYGFPHQFAKVQDTKGRTWEIAYADLYNGDQKDRSQAPALILLHGRGMNSGAWGKLLDSPLAAGFRVVTIDWSHSGKSLPKNLEIPVNRSHDDARQLIYNLVVKHLGIAKASYLGHSLGGQIAAGYALQHPEAVDRLVLYASGGLESIQPFSLKGIRLDDPKLANNEAAFAAAWNAGALQGMGESEDVIARGFYKPQRGSALPYASEQDELGRFMVESRAKILRGNPRERERMQQIYAWDTPASLMECRVEDLNSLPNRISRLKPPTLIVMGLRDPIFPNPASGNSSLVNDVIQPLFMMAKSRNSPIQIKLYPQGGHFLHTDLPEEFSKDVVSFLKTGATPGPLYAGDPQAYLPAARTILSNLPKEVEEFKTKTEKAFRENDFAVYSRLVPEDFKNNGENRTQLLARIEPLMSAITSYSVAIFSVTQEKDEFVVDLEWRLNFGNFPLVTRIAQRDGQWVNIGNRQ